MKCVLDLSLHTIHPPFAFETTRTSLGFGEITGGALCAVRQAGHTGIVPGAAGRAHGSAPGAKLARGTRRLLCRTSSLVMPGTHRHACRGPVRGCELTIETRRAALIVRFDFRGAAPFAPNACIGTYPLAKAR